MSHDGLEQPEPLEDVVWDHGLRFGMASDQLDTIVALLRARPITDAPTIEAMRAGMDSFIGAFAPPPALRLEPVDAGGVPAEWTIAAGAGDLPVVFYLHGGGYCLGSVATHRPLCTNLS